MSFLKTEPAIFWTLILGAFSALGSFFLDIGADVNTYTAIGKAVGLFGLSGAVGGVIRQTVYSPATADDIMDADAVIRAAEHGDHEE